MFRLDASWNKLFNLLKAGVKVFTMAITAYVKAYVKHYEIFIKVYGKRLAKGDTYPGYLDPLVLWLNKEAASITQQAVISDKTFIFLDEKILRKIFEDISEDNGFKIITFKMTDLSGSWSLDSRENVILITQKPQSL